VDTSIDVIIPTFCRPVHAEKLTLSLIPQLSENDHIYVVWQGCDKPHIRETENVHVLRSSPASLPRARNAGVRAGKGGIVLFLDDDCAAMPGLLDNHRKAYGDPSVGAVAGRIDDPLFTHYAENPRFCRGPSATGCRNKQEDTAAFFDETTGRLQQNFCVEKSQYTVSVMGANMSFLRDALCAIGLFDENFKHNAWWEEVDAAFRLRKAGYAIWYCHLAPVRHLREKGGGCRVDGKRAYLYHQFANTAYFAARHCEKKYRGSWFTYWKYRLEYESRHGLLWLRHDPGMVLAGILGALAGILRYVFWGRL
jgi:GT2 family glycosyltransferase